VALGAGGRRGIVGQAVRPPVAPIIPASRTLETSLPIT
jgi:hypothetical protein